MNGDISVEASRPRPLSGGIWTLFSWLRRDERSFSDESLSSVGSDRTAVSFAFLEPLHYKAATEPIVLPPLSPPTDSYKKRVRDRNFRRQRERDITLHRKYGLFKGENNDRYDVLSLPPARRNILNSSDKVERGRRATSETFQRRAPYVPGKRRAPLPPTVTTSLPRNLSRKRPAPPPPTKLTEIPKQSIELCAQSMNTKPSCDKPSSSSKNVSIDAKIERNNREEKIKSDKSFLKQIFENKKRNSAIETNYVKLLPNISELDKQAAKIIEDKKLKVLEGNAIISMSGTNSTSADNKEKWICTLCLRRYNAAVSSCLYCVKNEKHTHEPFKDNVNISPNVPANIYTQTDNELLNVASTSKAGLSEEKKKLKEMLKEMKDSLPKRPKRSIIDTESPTLRIGSTLNHEDVSTLNIESPKSDNTFVKSLDKLKVQNTEENVSIVALKGCIATNKNGSNSHPSSSNISTNYPVKEITPQSEYKNTGQKEFQTPDTSTEIINKNIFFNHQSNVSSEMVPSTNLKTTNQCNGKQNETESLFQPKDSFSKIEFIKKEKINNTQLEFQPNLSKSKITPKIKESQSSIIIKNTPKPLEVMHSVINKAPLDSDLSDNIQMRRINTQENNIKPEVLQTKTVNKSSICNKPNTNVERRKNENNTRQSAPEVYSKLKEESDEIGKSTDKTKTTSHIDAPSIHTPLKISSLLNPFYLPAQTNRVNIETSININKTTKSNVTPLTSSDILQQPSNVSISKSPKSVKEISETNEKENTSKEINSASNITANDQYSTNTSVCKVLGVTPSSLSKEINNNNLGKINHHFRRRELVNQLEQSIAKGDEQSAADAAVKLAKLRLSCSVLSFSSQIVGNVPTTSKIDIPILKPNENETNKIIKSDLDEKHKKQNVASKSIKQNNLQLKCHNITKSPNKNNEHVPKASTSIVGDQENKTRTNRVITSAINVPCEPSTSKSNPVENGTISIQIWIEDKEATRGPVNLRIPRDAVMGELRLQAERSLGLDSRLQRWIIGRTLCLDDTIPLASLAGPDLSAPFYLCLVESESNKENANDEQAKEHEQDKQNNIIGNTREVYTALMKLEQQALVANTESFECSVCMEECEAGKGAVLRECIHTFCRDCLSDAVRHCEEPIVSCPATGCPGILQEREIRALLPTEEYERWLARGLATAECGTRNAFHCRTPDCTGWALCEPGVRKFPCPVCKCNNCVPCQAIHEAETCEQYQIKLRTAVTAAQTNETDEGTRALLNSLIRRGEALECPECHAIITKKWGCDWVKCSACKTEICWVTRGRRWGPGGRGDTSAGCRCGVDGKKCHPSCGYCH